MKKCSSCGTFNKEDDIFCKYCGNELNLFLQSCPRCKTPVEPLAKFCKKCGYDVSKLNKQQISPPNKPDKKLIIAIAAVSSIILISIIILFVFIYKPTGKAPAIPATIADTSDTSASETTTSSAEESETSPETTNPEELPGTTESSESETTSALEETTHDYEYILGDYSGFQIREDGDKFLKRINIFENGDYIRIECYSEKNDAPTLEDFPIGVVDIPKNDIRVSNKRITLDFDYEVDFRPEENKIGYFDMRLKFYLDEPDILEGITYYDAKFINGKTVSHTYTFELERY